MVETFQLQDFMPGCDPNNSGIYMPFDDDLIYNIIRHDTILAVKTGESLSGC
jgi:hypothetical protein